MVILYHSEPKRGAHWQQQIKAAFPNIEFRLWPDHGDLNEIPALVVWQLKPELLAQLPNLEVIFTVSAGVDQIPTEYVPKNVTLVRMINTDLEQQLTEYACMGVLNIYRGLPLFTAQQRNHLWKPWYCKPANQLNVGVMGLGQQGKAVLRGLQQFHFNCKGWARSQHDIEGVDCFAGTKELNTFLSDLDVLICLLPLTAETKGILNQDIFTALPQGASLINMGRGEHVNEEDLIEALNSEQLSYALLDVACVEPLPEQHTFWSHPKVQLTPHIAGITRPEAGFISLKENIERWQKGLPLLGVVDLNQGY